MHIGVSHHIAWSWAWTGTDLHREHGSLFRCVYGPGLGNGIRMAFYLSVLVCIGLDWGLCAYWKTRGECRKVVNKKSGKEERVNSASKKRGKLNKSCFYSKWS